MDYDKGHTLRPIIVGWTFLRLSLGSNRGFKIAYLDELCTKQLLNLSKYFYIFIYQKIIILSKKSQNRSIQLRVGNYGSL